jgi:branched-chain amino acid transport system ATP-binding protein
MAESTALEVSDLTLRYGGLVALQGVNIKVAEGEIAGLIGPNGAGKTSLVNVITGMARARSGDIRLFGESIARLPAYRRSRRGLARTFQISRPLVRMTVFENALVGAYFGRGGLKASRPEAASRAEHELERVGLLDRAHLPVEALNLADRQMLELARVLAGQPRVLILDEVMAGSNPTEVGRKVKLLRELNGEGLTMVVIEHVMAAVMALSHRVVVLHHGQLLADRPPEAVTRNPRVIEAYLGQRASSGDGERVAELAARATAEAAAKFTDAVD